MVFILLFSFSIFFILLGFFCHWAHEFFAKSFGLSLLNHHIFTFRAYWPLCQHHEFTNSFLELPRPFFTFSLSLRILMGLLLHSLGFLDLFFFFFGHLLFCGPVDHYSCYSGLMVFILLFSFSIFFILLGFFCNWALLSKVGINIQKISTQHES